MQPPVSPNVPAATGPRSDAPDQAEAAGTGAGGLDPLKPPWTTALMVAAALVIGLTMVSAGPFAFTVSGAVNGVLGQLPTTLPAAILVLVATGLNVAAGAALMRFGSGRPFAGRAQLLLSGFVGAVLLDILLLGALAGTGLFRWPVLAGIHLLVLALAVRARTAAGGVPLSQLLASLRPHRPAVSPWWPIWLVVLLTWSGVVILQLASPVVPFVDVLPNHVAPVEHLRAFGDFATLATTASPIYGPSRTFLGYDALLGVIDTLANLPAALGVAAFALPAAIAVALGMHRLGTALGGGRAGTWVVLAFMLTTSFVRLPDVRATVLVLPLAAWSLAEVADRMAGRRPASLRGAILLGAGLAAAILVHPVIGALTILTVGFATLARPGRSADLTVPAMGVATILALPQVATMTEQAVPTMAALLVIPPALAAGWLLARSAGIRRALVIGGWLLITGVVLGCLISAGTVLEAARASLGKLLPTIPILIATTLAGLLVQPRRLLAPVLLGGLLAGAVAATATGLVPEGAGTLAAALRFEVPKTLHYWLPVIFALAAGLALDSIWSDEHLPLVVPRVALAAFLIMAILPLRQEPLTDAYYLGERRAGETLSLQLRTAELGYWQGYPDSRRLVAGDQLGLLDAVRAEIQAGRLGPGSVVLHVARSFQQWAAVPLGVFTGVIETDATPDAEVSIHTVGGRLRRLVDLPGLLAEAPPYVLLEPAGLAPETRSRIVAAGYRSIFTTARGELFARGG